MIIHDVPQNTPEWEKLRAGMPTASSFPKLITSEGEPSKSMPVYANLLAAELYSDLPLNDFEGNKWTERGHELEDAAADKYEFLRNKETVKVGFVTDDDKTMGCSPDRFVYDDGMIEIKCLKTENHVAAILYHQKHKRCESKYTQQAQGQMYICQRKWVDMVFYHPSLPMLIIRQEPDKKIIDGLTSQIFKVRQMRDQTLKILKEL